MVGLLRGGAISGHGASRGLGGLGGGLPPVSLFRGGCISGHRFSRDLGRLSGDTALVVQLDLIRVLFRLLGNRSVSLLGRVAEFSAQRVAFFSCHIYLQNVIYLQKCTPVWGTFLQTNSYSNPAVPPLDNGC